MKKFINKKILFLISIITIYHFNVSAIEIYVLCSDINFNYNWIPQKVKGVWEKKEGLFSESKYFILDGGAHSYLILYSQCIKKFGNEYSYLLAADDLDQKWYRIAVDSSIIIKAPWDEPKYINESFVFIHIPPVL